MCRSPTDAGGLQYHHSPVRKCDEGRVVMVVGLKPASDQHRLLGALVEVILLGLDVAEIVDAADVGLVDAEGLVFMMKGTRVGKPAPGAFICHDGECHG